MKKNEQDNLEITDVSISFYEEKEDGTIIRKNPTTKIHLVEGLEETLESLVRDIEGAGSISTVNGISPDKDKNVFLANTDILRTEPRLADDRPYSYPIGISEFYVSPRDVKDHGFPFEYSGVVTYRIAVESTVQFCFDYINEGKSKNTMKVRFHNFREENEWGEWSGFVTTEDLLAKADKEHSHTTAEITDKNTTETQEKINEQIGNYIKPTLFKGDLNDLIDMGRYYVADTATNTPASGGWFVDVYVANIQNAGALHRYQVAYKMTGEKSVYARNQWGGEWTPWQRTDGRNKVEKIYVDEELKKKAPIRHGHYAHEITDNDTNKSQAIVNTTFKEGLEHLEQELSKVFQSGVESNQNMVDVLNSMNVEASAQNTVLKNSQLLKTVPIKGAWNNTVTKEGFWVNIPEGYHKGGRVTCRIQGFDTENFPVGITMGGKEGTMPNHGSLNKTLTTQNGSVNVPAGYYTGGQVRTNITNLISSNIKQGVYVGGIRGTFGGTKEYKKEVSIGHHTDFKTTTLTVPGTIIGGTVTGGGEDMMDENWCVFDVSSEEVISGKNLYLDKVAKVGSNKLEIRTYGYSSIYPTIVRLIIEA